LGSRPACPRGLTITATD